MNMLLRDGWFGFVLFSVSFAFSFSIFVKIKTKQKKKNKNKNKNEKILKTTHEHRFTNGH